MAKRALPIANLELLAGRLRAAREIAGLSQKEAARQAGVLPSQLSKYEKGDIEPALGVLKKLCDLYKVDPGVLLAPLQTEPLLEGQEVDLEAARVGYRLLRLRGSMGLAELARRSGLPEEHLRWYEGGVQVPGEEAVRALARALDCSPGDITGKGTLPERPAASEPPEAQSPPPGHAVIRLPRGDPEPLSPRHAELLEMALTILRARGEAQEMALALEQNIRSFHKGVQALTILESGRPRDRAAGDDG